jgi:hypothetical protein
MFVIYHKDTSQFLRIMRAGYWQDAKFATEGAAKACLTRLAKAGKLVSSEYLIGPVESVPQKTRIVKNLMSGKDVEIPVNTPRCCDPSTELYWSM